MRRLFKLTLALTIPLFILSSSETRQGSDLIAEAMERYAEGGNNDFLATHDKKYQAKRASRELDWLLEKREELSHLASAQKSKKELTSQDKLKERRDYALSKILGTKMTLTSKESTALDFMDKLHKKFTGQGDTPFENQLIEIDVEYDMKRLLLDTEYSTVKEPDLDTYQEKQIALELEKGEKMLKLCGESDEPLKKTVELAIGALPKKLAISLHEGYLRSVAQKSYQPKIRKEIELQTVMQNFFLMEALLMEQQ